MGQGTRIQTAHQLGSRGHSGSLTDEFTNGLHQIQGINMTTDMEFMSALLFDAYMADAITGSEVRRACAILNIAYPPIKGNQATRQAPEFSIIEEVN